ncbi:MAG: hypothetical protein IV090_16840 [Candidatus Sericytochromatia bacterium]|nr:hypothetical protein [Candidatus Sericytochromatia bacterium]
MNPIKDELMKAKEKADIVLKSRVNINTQSEILEINEETLENIEGIRNSNELYDLEEDRQHDKNEGDPDEGES